MIKIHALVRDYEGLAEEHHELDGEGRSALDLDAVGGLIRVRIGPRVVLGLGLGLRLGFGLGLGLGSTRVFGIERGFWGTE